MDDVGLPRGTVELREHRPAWRRRYEAAVERLDELAGDRFRDYEHVGSTAVEGLAAKPIIDVLAVVDDLDAAADLVPLLAANGYDHRPNDDVADRLFFAKGPETNRTHYLSVCERDADCYREQVAFRDYLRADSDAAARYEELKRELAEAHPDDRESYTAEKSAFVERALARSEE